MSASANTDSAKAVSNQEGEFSSRVAASEPQQTTGHQPGLLRGNDAVPEFHAQTLPAGSTDSAHHFKPQTQNEVPGQALDNLAAEQTEQGATTSASDTLGGATSAEVHQGYGHPGQGQSSNELRHDGQSGRKHDRAGLQGVGASGAESGVQKDRSGKRVEDV